MQISHTIHEVCREGNKQAVVEIKGFEKQASSIPGVK